MLRKMKDSEFEQYADGVKIKEDFINRSRMGLCSEAEEILLFEYQGSTRISSYNDCSLF